MRFNKFDLNLLVALDALLTECNTTRAAAKVHITQSAMSNALNRLRAYFEGELLVRVGQRMELTPRAESQRDPVHDMQLRFETSIAAKPEFDCTQSDREFTIFVSDYSMQMLMPRDGAGGTTGEQGPVSDPHRQGHQMADDVSAQARCLPRIWSNPTGVVH